MVAFSLLLAAVDWEPLIRVIVPLIVALIYAINQIFNRERKNQPTKQARPAPRRVPTPPPAAKRVPMQPVSGRPTDPASGDPLLAEIQKFLKQASGDRAVQARAQAAAKPQRPKPAEVRPAEPASRPIASLQGRHLDTTEVTSGSSHLIDDLKRADMEREQHFEQMFRHKIGSLADTSTPGLKDTAPASTAGTQTDGSAPIGEFLTLRTAPEDLRRAFMLNEILQRPVHRW